MKLFRSKLEVQKDEIDYKKLNFLLIFLTSPIIVAFYLHVYINHLIYLNICIHRNNSLTIIKK